jgi:hypothetical protein
VKEERKMQIEKCKSWSLLFQLSCSQHSISDFNSQISDFKFEIWSAILLTLTLYSLTPAATPPSTDDQLRDSLNSKTGDDYDRELLGDSAKTVDKDQVDDALQKRLQKELGQAAKKEDNPQNPLLSVAQTMRQVPQRLYKGDSGEETQFLQRQVVTDLQKLIDEAKKSAGSCKGSQGPRPAGIPKPAANPPQAGRSNQPARESGPQEPESSTSAAAKDAVKRMKSLFHAELRQKSNREEMIENPAEYFLPGFELEIEDYFRRLSEDQPQVAKP